MNKSRTIACLLGAVSLLLGAGKAAWAADYSGTLAFDSQTANVTIDVLGTPVSAKVGVDLDRYNLGNSLSGAPDINLTTHNSFNKDRTMLAVLFATDPNEAIFNNPTSLAAFIDPSTNIKTFLDAHVTGWQYYAYGNVIASNGTTSISGLLPSLKFEAGKTYYAFVTGGSAYSGGTLTDASVDYTLSVGAVPEPGEWAMMVAGLGLMGLLQRRRSGRAVA
jgi:hypothetical protein